jgi:prepilin-type processing-associated H-X9-DG protein
MSRRMIVLLIGLMVFTGVGFVLAYVVKVRGTADDVRCKNNLREITLFAAHHADLQPGVPVGKYLERIPAGTVALPGVAPEERLSWYVSVLPGLDQKRQDTAPLLAAMDQEQPWTAVANQLAARHRLLVVLCPGNPPQSNPGEPALSSYVGIAGLGRDAPTLPLAVGGPAPPRAGCFRYDAPTPFEAITDGLSQTLLIGERSHDLGPWLRGGPATVWGLDDGPDAKRLQGPGGQFGGNHPNGANWAFADGSVRFFTDDVNPQVLFGLATIAGKETDPLPGD